MIIGENVDILGPEQEYISEVGLYVTPGSFKNCLSIQTIDVKNPTPPTGAEFSDAVYSKAQLTVPAESKSLYKEAIGWKDFVSLMKYKITYVVDDSIYFADTLLVGDTIILPATPIKEGYTFSGWSEVPETMPAHDVEIYGNFFLSSTVDNIDMPTKKSQKVIENNQLFILLPNGKKYNIMGQEL